MKLERRFVARMAPSVWPRPSVCHVKKTKAPPALNHGPSRKKRNQLAHALNGNIENVSLCEDALPRHLGDPGSQC